MANQTATDNLSQTRWKESGSHHHEEHYEVHREAESEASNYDLEKHALDEANHDLTHVSLEDEEYVVTAKTWTVVIVHHPSSNTVFTPANSI